jgi:hypothetical protein
MFPLAIVGISGKAVFGLSAAAIVRIFYGGEGCGLAFFLRSGRPKPVGVFHEVSGRGTA